MRTILAILIVLAAPLAHAGVQIELDEPCIRQSGAPLEDLDRTVFEVFEGGTNISVVTTVVPKESSSTTCVQDVPVDIPFDLAGREGQSFDVVARSFDSQDLQSAPSQLQSFTVPTIPDPPAEDPPAAPAIIVRSLTLQLQLCTVLPDGTIGECQEATTP